MLDLKRTIIGRELGINAVNPTTTFQAGQVGVLNSTGQVTAYVAGTKPAGVFKWNKTSTLNGAVQSEAIVVNTDGTTATNLKHANVSNVKVLSAAGFIYSLTLDYTVNTTNGTVTRVSTGTIPSGGTVYVSYTYQLTTADINTSNITGLNFFLNTDDTQGSNNITIVQGFSRVFTDQYDTGKTYAINTAVYPNSSGLFTTDTSNNYLLGRVVSVPSASDPFLGIEGMFGADL